MKRNTGFDGLVVIGLLILRIFGKEKLLAHDVDGYQEYPDKLGVTSVWYHTPGMYSSPSTDFRVA